MKLFLILLAISLQVSAAVYSQEITLSLHKASLKEVMQSIRKQTGYSFVTESVNLKTANPVTITLHTAKIEEALLKIFETQPFSYLIENKSIIIKKKDPTPPTPTDQVDTDPIIIKGKVTDRNNKPLPGVNIRIKGRDIGTVTDINGNYLLKADGPGTVIFSYIGFRSHEKKISVPIELNISLDEISAQLDQVQIIAYGTTTKRFNTSNISSIKADDIVKQPISNLLFSLQGRMPGINLNQTSGVPGADVTVRVQGENSLRNGNEAFYVIDGIPYTPQNLYSGIIKGAIPGTGSTLSFLNPSDVESIEVLKDADATAIYGSRASNGAILITTKKGKPGKTKVDVNMQTGWGEITKKIKLLNTDQYLEIRKEAIKNGGNVIGPTDYDVDGTWGNDRYTDWQKELLGKTSHYTNLQASISGGTNGTQFLAGGGYIKETTVFPGDFSDSKGNVHLNINHNSENKKFQFSINTNYLQDLNKLPPIDLTTFAISLAPNAPALYNNDGTVNWQPKKDNPNLYTFTELENPASSLARRYRGKTNNLLSNVLIGYNILPSLNIKVSGGYNRLQTNEISITPQASFSPSNTFNMRSAVYGDKSITSWIVEPQLTFSHDYSFGKLDALIGSSFQSTDKSVVAFDGRNYANDTQLENSLAAGDITPNSSTMQSRYRYNAIFGRINYQLKSKYILNLTARRDGSSRFGSANLFNSFYSIGGAWLFADEKWFNVSPISFGKIRATYGTTGNDQIQDYQFLNLYSNYIPNVLVPYQQSVGLLPTGHANPYLQWEETRKLNLGLDLGLWDDRLLINANFYRNRSSNQLLTYTLPFLTGFPSVQRNIPALVQNSGWELQVDITPLKQTTVLWRISGNITIPKNKLIDYPGLEASTFKDYYIIGKPTNIVKVYEFAGVDDKTGLYQFKSFNGKLTSTPDYNTDRTKVETLGQTLYGGLSNSISYKGIDISFLFQFVRQKAKNYRFGGFVPGFYNSNQPVEILDRWKEIGDKTKIQQVSTSYNAFFPFIYAVDSDAAYSDASFIRLKNASISYSLNERWLSKTGISSARIYIIGQNLLTFTNFKGGDPESGQPGILPPIRVISTGFQLTF